MRGEAFTKATQPFVLRRRGYSRQFPQNSLKTYLQQKQKSKTIVILFCLNKPMTYYKIKSVN